MRKVILAIGLFLPLLLPTWAFSQFPAVVAHISLTGQTASINTTPIYTPTVAGPFRVSIYLYVITTGSGNINASTTWNDGAAHSGTVGSIGLSTLTFKQGDYVIQSAAGQHINYSTTFSASTGSYGVDVVVEQLQ